MTDWQQPLVVALTQAKGISVIHETVYENRFGFTKALVDMGANVQTYCECLGGLQCRFGHRNFRHSAVVQGPTPLKGTDVEVPDLRGGFSHLIAALAAHGESVVSGIDIIDRGYENFMQKAQERMLNEMRNEVPDFVPDMVKARGDYYDKHYHK